MKRLTHEELREMLPAYALGALVGDELAAVDAAMREGSPGARELKQELRAFQGVATAIATTQAVAPPPETRDRLLARIATGKEARVVTPSVRRTPLWLVGSLAATLVLAAGLGVYSMSLRQALVHREHTLNSILEADEKLRVATVMASDTVTGPGMQFFWNEKQRRGVVHAFRMPPASAGRSYQVWLLQDGKPVSISVFNSDPDGHAIVDNLTLPASSQGATLVLVTEEPAGGSLGPTTTPFMRGELGR